MITPWPYADMYRDLKPHIEDWDYSNYNLVSPVIKPRSMTREEVFQEALSCYKKYYLTKIPQWNGLEDEFKKDLLFKGLRAMMQNSFLRNHMSAMGSHACRNPTNAILKSESPTVRDRELYSCASSR